MKMLTKPLALLLAVLMAFSFGLSASAAEPTPEERDKLPELILDQATTGTLEGTESEYWYRFTATEEGYYHFIVNGALVRYSVYFEHGERELSFPSKGVTDDKAILSAGETQYVRIYTISANQEFSVTVEYAGPFDFWQEMKEMFSFDFSNFSIIKLLADIGRIPLAGIMLGFFFAPFSVGGTLILSLISALFLPVTLLLSPFILIQSIKDRSN